MSFTNAQSVIAEIEATVRLLAAESPDFIYTRDTRPDQPGECRYEPTPGNPEGCIVGAAARRNGIVLDGISGGVQRVLADLLGIDCAASLSWLADVQACQDSGDSWSYAVSFADKEAGSPDIFEAGIEGLV